MKPRAQLDHLLIDVDFLDKPKVKALLHRFGPLAQFYLIKIYMALSRATDAEMSIDAAKGLAWEIRLENQADAILEYLLEQEMLHSPRAGFISSERVVKDQEALAESREKWRAKKGGAVSPPSPRIPRRFPGDSPETPPPIPPESVKSEDLNNEDLKTKEDTPAKPPVSAAALGWQADELEVLQRWCEYRRRKRLQLDEIQLEALVAQWAHDRRGFIRSANYAITNGHRNLNPQPEPSARAGPWSPERDAELRKKKLKEEVEKCKQQQATR
jgi:hypothetical protein